MTTAVAMLSRSCVVGMGQQHDISVVVYMLEEVGVDVVLGLPAGQGFCPPTF